MIKNMDPTTGFFTEPSFLTTVFYGILAVISFFIIVLTFFSAKIPAALAPTGRRFFLALFSIAFSATLFYDAIYNYIPHKNETATIIQNTNSLTNLHHIHAVFAFLSCCYFLIFALSYFIGKNFHKKVKILSLAPLAWSITKVLEKISVIISIVRVSELLLELIACVFLMLFFMTFARVASDVNCKGSMWSVIACGSVSVLFILTYSIPRFMLTFTGNEAMLVNGYPLNYAEIVCAAFILIFIITVLRSGYDVEEVKIMNEELEEEAAAEKAAEEEAAMKAAEEARIAEEAAKKAAAIITSETANEPETELPHEEETDLTPEAETTVEETAQAEEEPVQHETEKAVAAELTEE